jgi:hypothetical protein
METHMEEQKLTGWPLVAIWAGLWVSSLGLMVAVIGLVKFCLTALFE